MHYSNKPVTTRPSQVVILAGGKGTRLSPITDNIPKPMIKFGGKPFLEHLIELVKEQGFEKILILLGYLPQPIVDYFGDGRKWGVTIEYSLSPEDYDTGLRLKEASQLIDGTFLLMYCDNYWPMNFEAMWQALRNSGKTGLITIFSNQYYNTRNNIRVDSESTVIEYDKTRTATNLTGVEIGFLVLPKSIIDLIPEHNSSLESEIYPILIKERSIYGYITQYPYYSIGSLERLSSTETFLSKSPTILLDRDGVLNVRKEPAEYVCSPSEWQWKPGALEALELLNTYGYTVIVISNQPGISRNKMSLSDLDDVNELMISECSDNGGKIHRAYYCTHGWEDNCSCRKPLPGLIFQAQQDFHFDITHTLFIGDDKRDQEAAISAGCPFTMLREKNSLLNIINRLLLATDPTGRPEIE